MQILLSELLPKLATSLIGLVSGAPAPPAQPPAFGQMLTEEMAAIEAALTPGAPGVPVAPVAPPPTTFETPVEDGELPIETTVPGEVAVVEDAEPQTDPASTPIVVAPSVPPPNPVAPVLEFDSDVPAPSEGEAPEATPVDRLPAPVTPPDAAIRALILQDNEIITPAAAVPIANAPAPEADDTDADAATALPPGRFPIPALDDLPDSADAVRHEHGNVEGAVRRLESVGQHIFSVPLNVEQRDVLQQSPVDQTMRSPAAMGTVNVPEQVVPPSHETPSIPLQLTRPTLETVADFAIKSVRLLLSSRGEETIQVRLVPEHLGELRISVSNADGGIHVRLASLTPDVRHVLEAHAAMLRDQLGRDGFPVSDVVVSSNLNLDASPGQGREAPQPPSGTSRHAQGNAPGQQSNPEPEGRRPRSAPNSGTLDVRI